MTREIVGFELRLPESWYEVPAGLDDVAAWARSTAATLVEGAGGGAPGQVDAQFEDTKAVLADQLSEVATVIREAGILVLQTAVMVRSPERGIVDAMVTLVAQQGLGAPEFTAQLEATAQSAEEPQVVHAGEILGSVDAGELAGVHMVLGHGADANLGDGVAMLEERVVLGVFPTDSPDMIEVTAVSRSVGTFEDMPQEMVDMLGGLTIESEALS